MNASNWVRKVTGTLGLGTAAVLLAAFGSGCASKGAKQARMLESRELVPAPYLAPAAGGSSVAQKDLKLPGGAAGGLLGDTFELKDLTVPSAKAKPETTTMKVQEPKAKGLTHKVKKGESLWEIGRMYGVEFKELAAYNKMKVDDVLLVGKTLQIPAGGKFVPEDQRPPIKRIPVPAIAPTQRHVLTAAVPTDGRYTVQKGDSLWVISRRYGMSLDELRRLNNLTGDTVFAGQVLALNSAAAKHVPAAVHTTSSRSTSTSHHSGTVVYASAPAAGTPAPAMATTATSAAASAAPAKYVVQPGDSFWKISQKFGIPVDEILKRNNLKHDSKIFPGQALVLKDGGDAALPATSTTVPGGPAAGGSVSAAASVPALGGVPAAADVSAAGGVDDVKKLQKLPHYVEPTDTLESIAAMYQSKVEWILGANPNVKTNKDLAAVKEIQVPVKPLN